MYFNAQDAQADLKNEAFFDSKIFFAHFFDSN